MRAGSGACGAVVLAACDGLTQGGELSSEGLARLDTSRWVDRGGSRGGGPVVKFGAVSRAGPHRTVGAGISGAGWTRAEPAVSKEKEAAEAAAREAHERAAEIQARHKQVIGGLMGGM